MAQMGKKFEKVCILLSENFQILLCQWAALFTPRPRAYPTRLSESLPFSKDMTENNEVVGDGAKLFDKPIK